MAATYYELLNVPPQVSAEALTRAWKIAARNNHPDRWQAHGFDSEEEANIRMADINRAYQILSDPRTRRAYDLEQGLIPARCGRCGQAGALRDGGNGSVIPLCDTCLGSASRAKDAWISS